MSRDEKVLWSPGLRAYVAGRASGAGVPPTLGTEAWAALADDDPLRSDAVLVAASRWCLETELRQRDYREWALKEAAREFSQQIAWAEVSRRVRARDQFYIDHPHLRRKAA